MTEIENSIERIMAAPVKGLVKLPECDFALVLALVRAARYGAQLRPQDKRQQAQGKRTTKAKGGSR